MLQTFRKFAINYRQLRLINTGKIANNETSALPAEEVADNSHPKKLEPINELVKTEKNGVITIISLNRPDKRNAINNEMASKLCDAITSFENDETSTIGVLHGIGGSFSSGYDINELGVDKLRPEEVLFHTEGSVGPTRRFIKKPMVCGISGYCIANGLALALMCDLRVVEEDAALGFFNRRFGVPLMDGCTARLPALIGLSRALDLILTGRIVSGKEAFEIGLANRLVASGTALGQAVNLASCLSKFPQAALNHDRNALYSATYNKTTFDAACNNEIMTISKHVLDEMSKGVEQFNKGIGKNGKTYNIKEKTMADWERFEYHKELEQKEDKNAKDT